MTMPTFTDGVVVHQASLNALSTGINNLSALLTGAVAPRAYIPTAWSYINVSHSIPNNVDTLVKFDAAGVNNDNMWVASVTPFTVQTAGNYAALAQVHFASNSTGIRAAHILFNGTAVSNSIASATNNNANTLTEGLVMNISSPLLACAAGATFYLSVFQNSGVALNITNSTSGTYMQVLRVGD